MSDKTREMLSEEEEDITVELELENGSKVTCAIITIFTVDAKDYIALLPMVEEDDEMYGEVWFYEYIEDEEHPEEEPELKYIEDEDVYDAVADAFDEYLDKQEFDEILPDED